MILALVLLPLFLGLISFAINNKKTLSNLLIFGGFAHLLLTTYIFITKKVVLNSWFFLDDLGMLFLFISSLLFLFSTIYGVWYFKEHAKHDNNKNLKTSIYAAFMFIFLATMSLTQISQHLGIIWIAIEATTLASAPLIFFHRKKTSLEATWKYLMLCSVGIGLALLGNFFFEVSAMGVSFEEPLIPNLIIKASQFNVVWLKAAFICFIVGYGTKMGLAPMHTWLPDAHSEAPTPVSALLSGALLNCAFLGLLRTHKVLMAANLGEFSQHLFLIFGVISIAISAIFLLSQQDFKRMLAYSSIENMGLLSLGIGIGGNAILGTFLHTISHSLIKATLFITSGNILLLYHSKAIKDVNNLIKVSRTTAIIWLLGFLAITGAPPFSIFSSKFIILKTLFDTKPNIAYFVIILLVIIFIGMSKTFIKMIFSSHTDEEPRDNKFSYLAYIPQTVLLCLSIIIGIHAPKFLIENLNNITNYFGVLK